MYLKKQNIDFFKFRIVLKLNEFKNISKQNFKVDKEMNFTLCHLLWCAWFLFGSFVALILITLVCFQCYKDNEGETASPPNNGKKGKCHKYL